MTFITRLSIFVAALLTALSSQAQLTTVTVSGSITQNTTWTNNNKYVLSGFVYVKNNATLTIEPGTIIAGDQVTKGSLIVTRGAKIMAIGTKAQPIVFTSNQPSGQRDYGDWGGVIILGKAPINQAAGEAEIEGGVNNAAGDGIYGGNDPDDNSGVLRFVRIELGGVAFQPNNEINGLTLGGVGRGTTIEFIQVSYNGDDGIENFGGTVNMKHLVLTKNLDDDLDTDNGYQGNIQFVLVTRDPNVADAAGDSNGFESDNDANGTNATPQTHPIYSNVTVIGPLETAATTISTFYKRGARLRRNTATSIYNSVIMGYPIGLQIEGSATEGNATNDVLQVRNVTLAGNTQQLAVNTGSTFDINAWFNTMGWGNQLLANTSDALLTAPYATAPNALPQAGSPLLNSASFSHANLNNPFFEQVTYRGAFGTEDWTACWTEWNPMNANYSNAINHNPTAAFGFTQNGNQFSFTNNSANATSYNWNFGVAGGASTDQNPVFNYTVPGNYTVTLISVNQCGSDTATQAVTIVGVNGVHTSLNAVLFPNPTQANAVLSFSTEAPELIRIELLDMTGRLLSTVVNATFATGNHHVNINTTGIAAGTYVINIVTANGAASLPLSLIR